MAKILVCYYCIDGEAFYDGICGQLHKHGNDVFRWNIRDYIDHKCWGEKFKLNQKGRAVLAEVLDFSPDAVIAFNNACPLEIAEDTDIPICLWDADAPNHFWHKEYIKEHQQRYYYLGFQTYSFNMYSSLFDIPEDRYTYCPAATTLQKEDCLPSQNISFIGNHFTDAVSFHSDMVTGNIEIMEFLRTELSNNFHSDDDELLIKYATLTQQEVSAAFSKQFKRVLHCIKFFNYPGIERVQHLSNLADLGLSIYGPASWKDLAGYYPNVAVCYNPERIQSLEDNAKVYNSSKISVNISHPQAASAFSWRVMDIMASNSCVLTEYKKDWHDLFGRYLSDEVRDSVVYTDKYDMRTKAVRLLENEVLRKKCVSECQGAVEKNGRWKVRIEQIEKLLGIKLINNEDVETIYFERILPVKRETDNLARKVKRMFRIMFYSFCFFVVNLPFLSLLPSALSCLKFWI